MVTQQEALQVKEKYESYYRGMEGVVGLGFDGTNILIYVIQLTPNLASMLPKTLDGIPVRTITTGGRFVPQQ